MAKTPGYPWECRRARDVRRNMSTKIGFLSFGHWQAVPGTQVRSDGGALLQSI
jgi:hypothetical protein